MIYLSCLNSDFDAVNNKNVQFDDYIQTSYTNSVRPAIAEASGGSNLVITYPSCLRSEFDAVKIVLNFGYTIQHSIFIL